MSTTPRRSDCADPGHIDHAKARVFADHLDPRYGELSSEQIDEVCSALLPQAPRLTCRQLAARLLAMVLAIDPARARQRYTRAVRDRQVSFYLDRNGTVTVAATGLAPRRGDRRV
jgi:hypothetical protein